MPWRNVLALGTLFALLCPFNVAALWWAVGSPGDLMTSSEQICRRSRRLGGRPRSICRREPRLVDEVVYGTRVAFDVCRHEFQNERWNCAAHTQAHVRGLVNILRLDNREAAYLQAVTSAGVMYAITQACTAGSLANCSCLRSKQLMSSDNLVEIEKSWENYGCSDNISYGDRLTRQFLDVPPEGGSSADVSSLLQTHNYRAGRLSLKRHMVKECKCHGLSGSCTMKLCWTRMPTLRSAGERLRQAYHSAHKVIISNRGNGLLIDNSAPYPTTTQQSEISLRPRKHNLVYTHESSDYCEPSKRMGSVGTRGRECDPYSSGPDACSSMCCRRGYDNVTILQEENCNCKFKYCCQVICDICEVHKKRFTCL